MYPDDWPEISRRIRERDNWRCRWCGETERIGVAHLDHDPQNCEDANLLTLCVRCHFRYDGRTGANHPGKQARRAATRQRNKAKRQQQSKLASLDGVRERIRNENVYFESEFRRPYKRIK